MTTTTWTARCVRQSSLGTYTYLCLFTLLHTLAIHPVGLQVATLSHTPCPTTALYYAPWTYCTTLSVRRRGTDQTSPALFLTTCLCLSLLPLHPPCSLFGPLVPSSCGYLAPTPATAAAAEWKHGEKEWGVHLVYPCPQNSSHAHTNRPDIYLFPSLPFSSCLFLAVTPLVIIFIGNQSSHPVDNNNNNNNMDDFKVSS